MKFYIEYNNIYNSFFHKVIVSKLTAIYCRSTLQVDFYKNGELHNTKNAAIMVDSYKGFYLNEEFYGNQNDFTKESWRRFVKLQVFL